MTLTCHYCKQMDTFDESSFWFETFFGSFEFLMAFYVQKLEYLLPFILLILYPYSLGVELEIQRLLMYWCKSCISIKYTSKKRVKCKKKSNPFIWAPNTSQCRHFPQEWCTIPKGGWFGKTLHKLNWIVFEWRVQKLRALKCYNHHKNCSQ